jgi:D-amino-acid oxidase
VSTVTVLGGGVSGLTSAIRLAEEGNDVQIVARDYLNGTTSWVATAIWHLFWVEIDDRVERWAASTLGELLDLAEDERAGVTVIRGIECIRSGTPEAVDFESGSTESLWMSVVPSYTALSRSELLSRLPEGYPTETLIGGYEIEVPIADMSVYMPYLADRLTKLGISSYTAEVRSIAELSGDFPADVYVNCTGLGARELVGDNSLRGVKGQIIRVKGDGVSSYIADDHSPIGMTYVLPRSSDVILGGTEDLDAEDGTVDDAVAKAILERCVGLEPRLADAVVIEHFAGVRPYRPSIRLELERAESETVVHNYGHGGSGVSLSWGCADDVAQLVGELR